MGRSKNKISIGFLLFLLIGISLGYALLSQDLTINGISKVKGNNWSIHFDNVQINSNSVALSTGDSAAAIDSNDDTLVNYTVTLNLPGDFYEFTVDAVNDGSIDGMIGEVVAKLNGTAISSTNPLPNYLSYTFMYSDGTPIINKHLLAVGVTETYKVRVEFKADIENSELPSTEQSSSFSFGISYVQKDENAIAVPHPTAIYMANMYDENNQENTLIWIGQAIPAAITQYSSAADAMAALTLANSGTPVPFYLKHFSSNAVVTESYVEFVVTSEMATANPGMTAGTYALRGSGATYNEQEDYYENDSPYYASNVATLQAAFGTDNCSGDEYEYSCSVSDLIAGANSDGYVGALCPLGGRYSEDIFRCGVSDVGASNCVAGNR